MIENSSKESSVLYVDNAVISGILVIPPPPLSTKTEDIGYVVIDPKVNAFARVVSLVDVATLAKKKFALLNLISFLKPITSIGIKATLALALPTAVAVCIDAPVACVFEENTDAVMPTIACAFTDILYLMLSIVPSASTSETYAKVDSSYTSEFGIRFLIGNGIC